MVTLIELIRRPLPSHIHGITIHRKSNPKYIRVELNSTDTGTRQAEAAIHEMMHVVEIVQKRKFSHRKIKQAAEVATEIISGLRPVYRTGKGLKVGALNATYMRNDSVSI